MLSKKISDVLNKQIQAEFFASHLYLAMSAYAESINLPGFATWMRQQSDEERAHALKLFDYVLDRDSEVLLREIAAPPHDYQSGLEMFTQALNHERKVSKMIHEAYEMAIKEHDHATEVLLQWFISEQVEEEKTAGDIVARLKMIGSDIPALLVFDDQLGARSPGEE